MGASTDAEPSSRLSEPDALLWNVAPFRTSSGRGECAEIHRAESPISAIRSTFFKRVFGLKSPFREEIC